MVHVGYSVFQSYETKDYKISRLNDIAKDRWPTDIYIACTHTHTLYESSQGVINLGK